jgi:hypothetical protein
VDVVGLAAELHQIDVELGDTVRMAVSAKMSIGSVNSLRRNLVTKTRCACSSDTLCRARR